MRTCTKCLVEKDEGSFYKRANRAGFHTHCKECMNADQMAWRTANAEHVRTSHRNRNLIRQYKITQADFDALLAEQGGRCLICRRTSDEAGVFHVDHDHACCPGRETCGKCIRGLLCSDCNTAIGLLQDSRERLQRALDYLTPEKKAA